jgi:hypothetical protein
MGMGVYSVIGLISSFGTKLKTAKALASIAHPFRSRVMPVEYSHTPRVPFEAVINSKALVEREPRPHDPSAEARAMHRVAHDTIKSQRLPLLERKQNSDEATGSHRAAGCNWDALRNRVPRVGWP